MIKEHRHDKIKKKHINEIFLYIQILNYTYKKISIIPTSPAAVPPPPPPPPLGGGASPHTPGQAHSVRS